MVADRLGFRFLDTGLMYRAVTLKAISRGVALEDEETLSALAAGLTIELISKLGGERLLIEGEDVTDRLRDPEVDRGVSAVSKVSGVRTALVKSQREMAEKEAVVMVGRDIGTVVLPDAGLKVYLSASVDLRARRRHRDLMESGDEAMLERVVADLTRRDKMDSERADSPLRVAHDAVRTDTDDLDIEGVVARILAMVD